jgi:hypothetical protein
MNRNLTRAVVVFGVLLFAAAALHFLQGRGVRDTITVNLVPTDGCTPRVTEVIGNAYLKVVRWNIVNGCTNAQVVTVQDVVTDNGSGGKTTTAVEVFRPQPVNSGNIPPSANPRPMTATIVRFVAFQTLYHYTICTRDQVTQANRCLDPDVEIWP